MAEASAPMRCFDAAPVVILNAPQLAENIGAVARVMANFGLSDLRLVNPRDGWPQERAWAAASGADWPLNDARVFDSVAERRSPTCSWSSPPPPGRARLQLPVLTPREAAARPVRGRRAAGERSGLLFGGERAGLETADIALCQAVVTIPIDPRFRSLNLAQAVAINAYEWRTTVQERRRRRLPDGPAARDRRGDAGPLRAPGARAGRRPASSIRRRRRRRWSRTCARRWPGAASPTRRCAPSAGVITALSKRPRAGAGEDRPEEEAKKGRGMSLSDLLDDLVNALQKDINDLSKIEHFSQMPALLYGIANRIGSPLNINSLTDLIRASEATIRRYIDLLKSLFLLYPLPSFSQSIDKKLSKASKIYFSDTALLLQSMDFDEERLVKLPNVLGQVFENFVIMELVKQATWGKESLKLYHYRTHDQKEVDFVLESSSGKVVGIEIKMSSIVRKDDLKGLMSLKEYCGNNFQKGIILYTGDITLPFGDSFTALPITALWQ